MPMFDISICLTNGAIVKVTWDFSANPESSLRNQLEQEDECTLVSNRSDAKLVIRKPKENVVGYVVDRISDR